MTGWGPGRLRRVARPVTPPGEERHRQPGHDEVGAPHHAVSSMPPSCPVPGAALTEPFQPGSGPSARASGVRPSRARRTARPGRGGNGQPGTTPGPSLDSQTAGRPRTVVANSLPVRGRDVGEHGGVVHDQGRAGRSLGRQGGQVGQQVTAVHGRRVAAGGGDRGGQPRPAAAFTGPEQARQPADIVVAGDVERVEVEPGPPDDLGNPGWQRHRPARLTPQRGAPADPGR